LRSPQCDHAAVQHYLLIFRKPNARKSCLIVYSVRGCRRLASRSDPSMVAEVTPQHQATGPDMSDLYLPSQASSSRHDYIDASGRAGRSGLGGVVKRGLDILGAGTLLLLILPVTLVIALIVRRDGGPILFRHTRVGLGGRRFPCLKFRSMVLDADKRLAELLAADPPPPRSGRPAASCRATPASPGSAASCAAPASTSCRSSSTCCAAR
jgi:hypothetical protein